MIGFGTKDKTKKETIECALNLGYTLLDTKDSNKSIIYFKNINFDRSKYFLCSKLMGEYSPQNHDPKNVYTECIKSLELAGLDFWDLYYIHTTHSFNDIPILDTYAEIVKLKNIGKILNIGLSNIVYEQLEAIILNSTKPDYIQVEIHPYLVEQRLVEFCLLNGIKIVAHSPLGSSLWNEISKEPVLLELSLKYQKSVSQIILKWHISRGIIPIPSSNNLDHIKSNLDLDFSITNDDLNSITNLNKNKRLFIKPNHYESIGKLCTPLPSRKIEVLNTDCNIVQNVISTGFHICNANVDDELYNLCIDINDEINKGSVKMKRSGTRHYEYNYVSENLNVYINKLNKNIFLQKIADEYTGKHRTNVYVKSSFPTRNLRPYDTGLYHRDSQMQRCLKCVIYLCDVNAQNGALKVIHPEPEAKLHWYSDKFSPRTTEEQIQQSFPPESIITIDGTKYTMIIFEGSMLHSGGYVQRGSRPSIYIEFTKPSKLLE